MRTGQRALSSSRARRPGQALAVPWREWWAWLAGVGLALSILLFVTIVFLEFDFRTASTTPMLKLAGALAPSLGWLACAAAGALVAWKRPDNPVGWLLMLSGIIWNGGSAVERYVIRPGPPFGSPAVASVMDSFGWVAGLASIGMLLLLFPTGRPPSVRWRFVGWMIAVNAVSLGTFLLVSPGSVTSFPHLQNPFGIDRAGALLAPLSDIARFGFFVGFWGAIASVAARYWWSSGAERQQLNWLVFGVALMATAFLMGAGAHLIGLEEAVFNVAALSVLPPTIVVGMLRYRLWDLDLVVRDTIVYALLVITITTIYIAFVAGPGLLISRGGRSDVMLVVLATAIAAVLLQPAREAAHQVARRLVFRAPVKEHDEAARVVIRTLGHFRVERGGVPLGRREWQSKKARQLLKMLVARRGQPIHREQLIDQLWPDEMAGNLGNRLAVAVSTVRSVLDPEKSLPSDHFVVSDEDTVRLNLSHLDVDSEQFLRDARDALRGDSDLAKTIQIYRGEFLPEDLYEDWAEPLREEARAAFLGLLRARADASTTAHESILFHLQILEVDPWDEYSHRKIIDALSEAGRHGEARRAYKRYETRMAEIGVTPGPL